MSSYSEGNDALLKIEDLLTNMRPDTVLMINLPSESDDRLQDLTVEDLRRHCSYFGPGGVMHPEQTHRIPGWAASAIDLEGAVRRAVLSYCGEYGVDELYPVPSVASRNLSPPELEPSASVRCGCGAAYEYIEDAADCLKCDDDLLEGREIYYEPKT